MQAYRLALLRKEFPFLDRLIVDRYGQTEVWPEEVDNILVKRGDANLLSQAGYEDSYSWSGGGHYHYTIYFAITEEDIVELYFAGKSATGSGEYKEWIVPTVGEQLLQRGIIPDWVVECRKIDTDDNGNGRVERHWVIYKMTRFDLAGYHKQQIDKAAAELKAEIEAACAEPITT